MFIDKYRVINIKAIKSETWHPFSNIIFNICSTKNFWIIFFPFWMRKKYIKCIKWQGYIRVYYIFVTIIAIISLNIIHIKSIFCSNMHTKPTIIINEQITGCIKTSFNINKPTVCIIPIAYTAFIAAFTAIAAISTSAVRKTWIVPYIIRRGTGNTGA
mgnify:CR=1 FL=1